MFTFISITYNHEKYIIEHLESIKYQILQYGKNEKVCFILSDDCSTDNTLLITQQWLKINSNNY